MWRINGTEISMAEGDWGIELPVTLSGTTVASGDTMTMTVKDAINGTQLLQKSLTRGSGNTFTLTLSSSDTALLPVGNYVYSLDWANAGNFLCSVIPAAELKVVEKA